MPVQFLASIRCIYFLSKYNSTRYSCRMTMTNDNNQLALSPRRGSGANFRKRVNRWTVGRKSFHERRWPYRPTCTSASACSASTTNTRLQEYSRSFFCIQLPQLPSPFLSGSNTTMNDFNLTLLLGIYTSLPSSKRLPREVLTLLSRFITSNSHIAW